MQRDQQTDSGNDSPHAGAESTHSSHIEEASMGDTVATTVDERLAEAEAKLACTTTLQRAARYRGPACRDQGQAAPPALQDRPLPLKYWSRPSQDEVETMRALTGSTSAVSGVGAEKSRLSMGTGTGAEPGLWPLSRPVFARLLGVRDIASDEPIPAWSSIREAYVQITGDAEVRGAAHPELSLVREANEVTTSVLNHALANAITKRLVQDYGAQPQDWRKFCVIRNIRDYKPQYRVLLHDFGALDSVSENAAYTNLSWDDTRETYTPAKRGNLVVVTREAILNDDLEAVRRIPTKLAIAAATTINEFVYGLFTDNPQLADNTTVFDKPTARPRTRTAATAALAASALQAAITQMMKQTNSAGKRSGPQAALPLAAAGSVLDCRDYSQQHPAARQPEQRRQSIAGHAGAHRGAAVQRYQGLLSDGRSGSDRVPGGGLHQRPGDAGACWCRTTRRPVRSSPTTLSATKCAGSSAAAGWTTGARTGRTWRRDVWGRGHIGNFSALRGWRSPLTPALSRWERGFAITIAISHRSGTVPRRGTIYRAPTDRQERWDCGPRFPLSFRQTLGRADSHRGTGSR